MAESAPPAPTAGELRWDLVLYGTACYVPACLVLTFLTSGGRQTSRVLLHFLTLPDPVPIAIGYGVGYLIVQYLVRNRRPSFLQSQIFAGCVFLGMFAGFAASSLVFSHGPLGNASSTVVAAVVVPVKVAAGALGGAWLYPFMASRRLSRRFYSPTPILPKYASGSPEPKGATPPAAPPPRPSTGRSKNARKRRR